MFVELLYENYYMNTTKFVKLLYEQVVCLLNYCMKSSKFVELLYEI